MQTLHGARAGWPCVEGWWSTGERPHSGLLADVKVLFDLTTWVLGFLNFQSITTKYVKMLHEKCTYYHVIPKHPVFSFCSHFFMDNCPRVALAWGPLPL